jgi:streptogramin lyase
MSMGRREFFSAAAIAGAGLLTGSRLSAQETPPPARAGGPPKPPTYAPKMEMLWKSPDRYPNALEATPEGLWVGDQVSERINLLDWKTGKVLEDFIGEAHNTSGLAVGGGFIWIGCNGSGTAANLREFKRPFDRSYGEIVKLDMKGKQQKGYKTPWGSVHGTCYVKETGMLWAVAPAFGFLAEMDPKDDLRISNMLQIKMNVPHGLDYYDGSWWVIDGADRLVQRIDSKTGRVQEIWAFGPNDPDPHGMCIHDNYIYFTDAGLGGGRKPSAGTKPQMIFRFPLTRT